MLYFENLKKGSFLLPSCSTPRQLDAARVRRGEELRQRTRESVVRNPSSPRRVRAWTDWTVGGGPEREPRCHGRGLSSGNRAVKPVRTASFGQAGALKGWWRWRGGGRRAARSRLLNLRRSEILLLTYRSRVVYMASLPGVAELIPGGEG